MTEDLFEPTVSAHGVTRPQVQAELERELKLRRRVYPRWSRDGKLDASVADHRIQCLEAAAELCARETTKPAMDAGVDEALAAFDAAARSEMMTLESWRDTAVAMQAQLLAGRQGTPPVALTARQPNPGSPLDQPLQRQRQALHERQDTAERLLRQLCERLVGTPVHEQSRCIEDVSLAIDTHLSERASQGDRV